MSELQFDLDTLLDLQVFYSPLKKVLQYLLLKDKTLTSSLNELEEKVNSNVSKMNEQQERLNSMNITVNELQELTGTHGEQITECTLCRNDSDKNKG